MWADRAADCADTVDPVMRADKGADCADAVFPVMCADKSAILTYAVFIAVYANVLTYAALTVVPSMICSLALRFAANCAYDSVCGFSRCILRVAVMLAFITAVLADAVLPGMGADILANGALAIFPRVLCSLTLSFAADGTFGSMCGFSRCILHVAVMFAFKTAVFADAVFPGMGADILANSALTVFPRVICSLTLWNVANCTRGSMSGFSRYILHAAVMLAFITAKLTDVVFPSMFFESLVVARSAFSCMLLRIISWTVG